jgi:hypothetical protein
MKAFGAEIERQQIEKVLKATSGNRNRAVQVLGIGERIPCIATCVSTGFPSSGLASCGGPPKGLTMPRHEGAT